MGGYDSSTGREQHQGQPARGVLRFRLLLLAPLRGSRCSSLHSAIVICVVEIGSCSSGKLDQDRLCQTGLDGGTARQARSGWEALPDRASSCTLRPAESTLLQAQSVRHSQFTPIKRAACETGASASAADVIDEGPKGLLSVFANYTAI